jgi:DNA-binding response OmpR family regulator
MLRSGSRPAMTLLCIDDDQDDLDLFQEAVRNVSSSHQCLVARNGRDGMKILESVKPDFIFLDINMPGLGGWDLVKMIRAKQDFDEVPVYMLSTTQNAAELEMFIRAGASQCLVKPSSFHELCLIFKNVITDKERR